jgi:succinate dehydrogenase / fumarate reductase cytochrome b subunit
LSTAASPTSLDYSKTAGPGTGIAGRNHFLLRRLHSLTGLVFGGYLVVHLLINATIAQGGNVYQTQVDKIHSLPFLALIEWTFIYLPILYHTAYGIWITVNGQWNVNHYPYEKNWFYVLQRISAVIIVFFMLFHVLSLKYGVFGPALKFEAHGAAMRTVAIHMDRSFLITWGLYPIGILASCYHLANGFWAAAITWGLTISKSAQRRWGYACLGLFVVTFVAGMIALAAAARLDPNTVPLAPNPHTQS